MTSRVWFLAAAIAVCAQAQDVRLVLRAPSAKFQMGEVIPLELAFTSTVPKRYQLNMATYDRSGRMSFEAWSREWSGPAAELRSVFGEETPNLWQDNLGQALARALARGQGWLADQAKLQRIQSLAVTINTRRDVELCLSSWSRPSTASIRYWPGEHPSFDVAQYGQLTLGALKAKLAQFPAGTTFEWQAGEREISDAQEKLFAEVARVVAEHNSKLVRRSE